MKNSNQAEVKSRKNSSAAPEQNRTHAPLPTLPGGRPSPLATIAGDPLGGRKSFEIELDWIGNSMEPEVYQGNRARVRRRESMTPCLNELVLGLLKNGSLVFGAFGMSDDDSLLRIAFINPAHPAAFYRESDFQWLYPVECISQFDQANRYRRIIKTIIFEAGDDAEATGLAPAAA